MYIEIKKTGQGIYRWSDGKPVKSDAGGVPDKTLQDRLVLSLLNAVADCLEAGIVEDADAADAGMIFGAGFAPFRGGPVNYARTRGIESIVQRLQEFEAVYGPRFKPSKGWKRLAG